MSKNKLIRRIEQGQSLVELAASFFMLMFLIGGIVDLGRGIITYFILQDAAQEGVVYGSSFPTDPTHINLRIMDNINSQSVKNSITITITIEGDPYPYTHTVVCAGKSMRIAIAYPFQFIMPFMKVFHNFTMNVNAYGAVLRPACP